LAGTPVLKGDAFSCKNSIMDENENMNSLEN
jgi:hypothetical protein